MLVMTVEISPDDCAQDHTISRLYRVYYSIYPAWPPAKAFFDTMCLVFLLRSYAKNRKQ